MGVDVEAVIWSKARLFLVSVDSSGPVLTPVCRGSESVEASIFQETLRLTDRVDSDAFPTVAGGNVLLCRGRVYMVSY